MNWVVDFRLGDFHEVDIMDTEWAATAGFELLEDQETVVSATLVCIWGDLMRGVSKSEVDQQEKAGGVTKSVSSLGNVSFSSTYLRSP